MKGHYIMEDLSFITAINQPLTPIQFIQRQIWSLIKLYTNDRFDDGDLKTIQDEGPFEVRGDEAYYYQEKITNDETPGLAALIAAFLLFQGRSDLVFQSQEAYEEMRERDELRNYLREPHIQYNNDDENEDEED